MDIFSLVLFSESSREHSLLSATFLLVWGEKNKRRSVCLFLIFPFVLFCFVLFCLCCCCYLLCVVSYSFFLRASVSVSVMYTLVYSTVWPPTTMHTPNMVIPYRLTNSYVTRKRTKHTHTHKSPQQPSAQHIIGTDLQMNTNHSTIGPPIVQYFEGKFSVFLPSTVPLSKWRVVCCLRNSVVKNIDDLFALT